MKRWTAIPALCIATVSLSLSLCGAAGAAEVKRPDKATTNCVEGECHARERNFKVLHGPTALGACDVCHVPAEKAKHTFTLKQKDKALCDFCHVQKIVGVVMHKPVEEGKCISCHNPHGASNKLMLRSTDAASLCAGCHGDVTKKRTHIHGPVAAGSCLACHNGHRSDNPKLLVAQGRQLCLGCHDQMNQQIKNVKYLHKPLEKDCQQCHEVHASNYIMQLKAAPMDLCLSCHEAVKKTLATAKHKHSAVTTGQACIACHTPHGSDTTKLVKSDLAKTCLTCHDKPIEAPDKHIVAAVPEVANKSLSLHGPIREGNCSGCHTLHGGEVSRLLAKPYPETFYESFDVQKYALCFNCHDQQLVLQAKTSGLTRFRNGEQNLHYAHVNKLDRGRSCRACHSTHASKFPLHIRETVPFGKWEMPINYKATKTGGSCAPGCHKEFSYDRDHPVPSSTTQPATKPGEVPKP